MNPATSHVTYFHSDNPHDMEKLTLCDEARRDAIAKLAATAAKLSAEGDKMGSPQNVYNTHCAQLERDISVLEERDTFERGLLMEFQMHYTHALNNLLTDN